MRINQYVALLDACVLASMPVADTLLRLAEEPAFYTPRWSKDILEELRRTLIKFGYDEVQASRRLERMQAAFPDALVKGYEGLIPAMMNHPKDRHVFAAAVRCEAHCIVSDNKRHFLSDLLQPFDLECMTADQFIENQYHLNPDLFIDKLRQQAEDIQWSLPKLISKHVPCLGKLIVMKK